MIGFHQIGSRLPSLQHYRVNIRFLAHCAGGIAGTLGEEIQCGPGRGVSGYTVRIGGVLLLFLCCCCLAFEACLSHLLRSLGSRGMPTHVWVVFNTCLGGCNWGGASVSVAGFTSLAAASFPSDPSCRLLWVCFRPISVGGLGCTPRRGHGQATQWMVGEGGLSVARRAAPQEQKGPKNTREATKVSSRQRPNLLICPPSSFTENDGVWSLTGFASRTEAEVVRRTPFWSLRNT